MYNIIPFRISWEEKCGSKLLFHGSCAARNLSLCTCIFTECPSRGFSKEILGFFRNSVSPGIPQLKQLNI